MLLGWIIQMKNIVSKDTTLFLNICLSSGVQSAVKSKILCKEISSYNNPTWQSGKLRWA